MFKFFSQFETRLVNVQNDRATVLLGKRTDTLGVGGPGSDEEEEEEEELERDTHTKLSFLLDENIETLVKSGVEAWESGCRLGAREGRTGRGWKKLWQQKQENWLSVTPLHSSHRSPEPFIDFLRHLLTTLCYLIPGTRVVHNRFLSPLRTSCSVDTSWRAEGAQNLGPEIQFTCNKWRRPTEEAKIRAPGYTTCAVESALDVLRNHGTDKMFYIHVNGTKEAIDYDVKCKPVEMRLYRVLCNNVKSFLPLIPQSAIMEMRTEGRIGRGRPRLKWEDTVERIGQKRGKTMVELRRMCRDRDQWRRWLDRASHCKRRSVRRLGYRKGGPIRARKTKHGVDHSRSSWYNWCGFQIIRSSEEEGYRIHNIKVGI
ncbi:hypothetical protein C0J52_10334 [Blattella germanica]|nr:hypothetical protein C0J52_10334 [Blattella germanica]